MSQISDLHIPCEVCGSSDAKCIYEDGHGYCFSCKTYFKPDGGQVAANEFTYQYLPLRGISEKTMEFFDVKTKIDNQGQPVSIGFRYPNSSYKIRLLDKKEFYSQGDIASAGLFGRDKFTAGTHKYVTITEGELDALSLYQTLQAPVASVQSAATALRDCTRDRSWLNSFERVYIAFDNDEPGREALRSVAKLFDYNKLYVVRFEHRKDANEFLQAGESSELRNIWWNSKKYLPDTIISSFKDFEKILKETPRTGVPYPFPTLTDMTYGIRTSESVLLTAQEGIGKTEIMHAIEHQLLRETNDNIGAIFLEEPKRRHLQAISGLVLEKPVHLPDCPVTQDEMVAALEEVVGVDDRLHLYSHFGSDDPEVLLDTIRFLVSARACRYILLDHISMSVSGLAGDDERRALDYFSTRLEMMVKELDFALIIVSHVNDMGQTRGSRYISKVADIRIDASRNLLAVDHLERNTTYLVVSKNRFSGKTGPAGRIVFDPVTFTMKETEDAFPTTAELQSRVA
jgi:twinkle protein